MNQHPHPVIALIGGACTLALFAGCGAPTPAQTTAASPTAYQCTPPTGATASPCTEQQYRDTLALAADYTAAEAVYRNFFAQDVALMKSGDLPSSTILALLDGPKVDKYKAARQDQHDLGLTTTGDYRLAYLRPSTATPYPGSDLVLDTCADATATKAFRDGHQLPGTGKMMKSHIHLKKGAVAPRIWWTDGEYVESC